MNCLAKVTRLFTHCAVVDGPLALGLDLFGFLGKVHCLINHSIAGPCSFYFQFHKVLWIYF